MVYKYTKGQPDMAAFILDGDPAHLTRKPQATPKNRSKRNNHMHTGPLCPGSQVVRPTVHDKIHGVDVTYWRVSTARPTNVVAVPCNHPSVKWQYDRTSTRQTARAYVPAGAAMGCPPMTTIVKVSTVSGTDKVKNRIAVHPAAWEAVSRGEDEISGDIIARMHRVDNTTRHELWRHIRDGGTVLAYVQ